MDPEVSVEPRRAHRWWIPAVAVAALVAVAAGLGLVPEERLAGDLKGMYITIAGIIAAAVWLAWYLFLGRFALGPRIVVGGVLAAGALFCAVAIRRIEFFGNMWPPIIEFVWDDDRNEILAAHRQTLAAADPLTADLVPGPGDCPAYRGENRDGVVSGPPLAMDWSVSPPAKVWRQPVGGGYAAFVVVANCAITIEQRAADEAVVCYDATNGRERWVYTYPALFSEKLGGDGPRATPTVAYGRVYALGATGLLTCLEGRTGQPIWSVNILDEAGATNLEWGMSGSPLVYDNLVVVNPGAQGSTSGRAVMALNATDGKLVWHVGQMAASYTSPMLAELGGTRQILIFDLEGLAGLDARDGRELWRYPWKSDFDINAAQPIVLDGQRVLLTSNKGAAVLRIAQADGKWSAEKVWRNHFLRGDYACPVVRDGYVYGLDKKILTCLDLADGTKKWKGGRYGHGQLLLCGELLLVLGEEGQLALVEARPDEFREVASMQALEGRTWNNPTLVDGRAYIRNHLEMACYDLRAQRTAERVEIFTAP